MIKILYDIRGLKEKLVGLKIIEIVDIFFMFRRGELSGESDTDVIWKMRKTVYLTSDNDIKITIKSNQVVLTNRNKGCS